MVDIKDGKDLAIKNRKRNILYLIVKYLQDEGWFRSADSLIIESQLTEDLKVCDNIDLELILQDYCNYFQLKFNKQPSICKKINNSGELMKLTTSPNLKKNKTQEVKPQVLKNDPLLECFTIKNIKRKFESDDPPKSIGSFLSHIPVEFKVFAEELYRESMDTREIFTWDDVKGAENAKECLKEACVYPELYPDLFNIVTPWRGILLHGPPGSGKTLLAKALACESKRMFFNVTPSKILSKWRGDSEKNIKILFDLARYYAPSIIFIDEIESLASKRDCPTEHEASRRLKCELLIELDGLNGNSQNILFLATSNLPWEIDSAFLRRMEKRIHIPLPDRTTRIEIFKGILKKFQNPINRIDFNTLSDTTEGYSGSDINTLCKEAAMISIRKMLSENQIKDKHTPQLSQHDLEASISKTKPTTMGNMEKYICWSNGIGAE